MDYGAVRSIDLAGGTRIPRLAEVLELVGDHADVFIEIKARGIEPEVVRDVRDGPAPARCAVHSFDHRSVQRVRALAPELRGGILLSSYLVDTVATLRGAAATDLWQWWEHIDQPLIRDVHAAGGRVIAWTVNDGDAARFLAAMGVDGLCTDDVGALRAALTQVAR